VKFACDSCQTKYTIPDEKVRGKVLKIRCKKCGSVITVKEDAAASEPEVQQPPMEERTRVADIGLLEKLRQAEENRNAPAARAAAPAPAPAPPAAHEWYAMVNGEQVGPFGHDDLQQRVDSGEVTDRSHVWRDGLADWKRAGEVDELQPLFAHSPLAVPAPTPRPSVPAPDHDDSSEQTAAVPARNTDDLFGDSEPEPAAAPSAEPVRANGHARPSGGIDHLLGDIGGDDEGEATGAAPVSMGADPFAGVPDAPGVGAPPIGEQTKFFMKQAGVTNRNPWWKYVIFAALALGLPIAAIYGLGQAGVGGTVMVVDASTGEQKQVAKYSFANIKSNGLGSLLSGAHAAANPAGPVKPKPRPKVPPTPVDTNNVDPKAKLTEQEKKTIADNSGLLSGDPTSTSPSSGPKERKGNKIADASGGAGLSDEAVAKVVADSASGFNKCVEDHLKRDPDWRGGKVTVSLKIGPSGTVLDTLIDKASVSNSDVGECLKVRAKRMHFPRFSGDEPQEVQFPLLLTTGG
jgi:predicted Zn finger-like uncharacterized protein